MRTSSGELSHSFSSAATSTSRHTRVRSPSHCDSGAPTTFSTDALPKSSPTVCLPPQQSQTPLATDIIPAIHSPTGESTPSSSSPPTSPVSPASWRTRVTPRPRLLRMLTEPSHFHHHHQQHLQQQTQQQQHLHHQQHQGRNSSTRPSEDLTFVSQTMASGSTAASVENNNSNNNNGNSTSVRHHHIQDLPQPRRTRARAPSVGSVPGSGWTLSIHTFGEERRRLSNTSENGSTSSHANNMASPLASPSARTTSLPHSRRRSSSVLQTGLRLAVGLSSPPQHVHLSQHLEQNNGNMGHTLVTEERVASGAAFRKSLVALPADSERKRDGASELFMVKAAPVTGLTTEDVVEQMRICGSTTAAATSSSSSSSSSSASATIAPPTDQLHKDGQEMTLAMTVSQSPAVIAPIALRDASTTGAAKRSIDSESSVSSVPSISDASPMETTVLMYDTVSGSSEIGWDAGDSSAAAHSDQWQLPSPVWKRARVRSDDDRQEEPARDLTGEDALVPSVAQPSTPEETSHPQAHSESHIAPLALVTVPVNDTQTEARANDVVDDATTPVNSYPPLPLPSPTGDAHNRTRTFSPPSLLEAFTSSEPVLSPIQSYFGSDPYSPSNFSFSRHDHYLGSMLSDDRGMQSGDSRMPVDDYHGFATHPWSEQSTPSHVLSHRWTRRVASSDGVPVLNNTVSHQGGMIHHHRYHHQPHHHSGRYDRATTRRSRNFAPAMVDRPWHELRSALPFASLTTATVIARANAATMTIDRDEGGISDSESDDLYEVDRDLMMAQEHLDSHDVADNEGSQADSRLDDGGDDDQEDDDDSFDAALRRMREARLRIRRARRLYLAQHYGEEEDEEEEGEREGDQEDDEADEGGEDNDDDDDGRRDELIGLELDEDDELEIGSYDDYGEYEMAYSNSFDHNHNLRYSDEEEDLEDDEEFGYAYRLSELSHSSSSMSRSADQRLSSSHGISSLSFWRHTGRHSPSLHSNASLPSPTEPRPLGRYVLRNLEGLDPGLELHDLEDGLDQMGGNDDHEIEVDDDTESLHPLDEDEEDELALMLGYENRHQNRRQASTLSEWQSPTWRMPRIGTVHHPGQSTTALSSDQYEAREGSQASEESDEMLARRLQREEFTEALRRRAAWLNDGPIPSQSILPMSPLHRLSRSRRRATSSTQTPPQQSSYDSAGAPTSPRRSLFSFSPRSTGPATGNATATAATSPSSSEPTVSALRRNGPTTTTSTATTSTPRLHSSQSRWHTSSTRSRLLVRMLEDRPRAVSMARRRRYRAGEDSPFVLSSPWMEQIWGNPADYLEDDQVDDSYEGLLRLSEQIGDAKSRGVPTKVLRMLDRFLFSWHSLHDGQDHPSMLTSRSSKTDRQLHGTTGGGGGGSTGGSLSSKALNGTHPNSGAAGSSSSSSSVPPHPLVVRKVRSVSQLKSSAGTGNTPLSATASTSGILGNANTSAVAGSSSASGQGALAASPSMASNGSGAVDQHARQLRRLTRQISQDCLRERRGHPLHAQTQQHARQALWSKGEEDDNKRSSLDLPGLADTCTICLQSYEAKDWLRPLPCRHAFHMGCIDTWLSNNCQCPICRQEVNQARIESMLHGASEGISGSSSTAAAK
ncbi:hypothetical protein BGZ73_005479 [Actinomortierella ambigua]|nr:hypothetical protein BGZ73_005479 [Actinomortierella ambigua]